MKSYSKTILTAALLLASAGLAPSLSATPLPAPLDGLDFVFNGAVKETYNSNVLSSAGNVGGVNTKFDDYIATFAPGFILKYGGIQDTTVTLSYTETFLRYLEHPSLNEELSNVGLTVQRNQGALKLTGSLSYVQNYNNTPSSTSAGLTSIIRSDVISASGNVHWDYSDKFNFDGGFGYTNTHYLYSVGRTFQDTDTYTLPISGYYVYTDKVSFGLGYTYSQTDPKAPAAGGAAGRSRYNNNFTFNVRLAEWNKLTGDANVGIVQNHVDSDPVSGTSSDDTVTGSYSLDMNYAYSDILSFNFTGSRNFSTGTVGQNIQSTSGGIGATYKYSNNINVQANLITYTYSQYLQQNRHDDTKTTGVTVNWQPYAYLTLSAAYSYFMNSSDAANSTYNINLVSISASVSY